MIYICILTMYLLFYRSKYYKKQEKDELGESFDCTFYVPLPDEHYNFYLACKKEFGRVYISGQYADYLAQRDELVGSYFMCIVIHADEEDPKNEWPVQLYY